MATAERRLVASTADVLACLGGLSQDELERRPPDGGWNAWEIAYHLFDIERWYIAKLCEATAHDRAQALTRFVEVWRRLREQTLALADVVPPERLDTQGLLSGVPDWTPRRLLDAIAAHDHEHAAQARAARAGIINPGEEDRRA